MPTVGSWRVVFSHERGTPVGGAVSRLSPRLLSRVGMQGAGCRVQGAGCRVQGAGEGYRFLSLVGLAGCVLIPSHELVSWPPHCPLPCAEVSKLLETNINIASNYQYY